MRDHLKLYIDGQWIEPSGSRTFDVSLLKNWINEVKMRVWFLFEAGRHAG